MNEIKIVTYNILADYLNSHEYVLVNKKYLDCDGKLKRFEIHSNLREICKKS